MRVGLIVRIVEPAPAPSASAMIAAALVRVTERHLRHAGVPERGLARTASRARARAPGVVLDSVCLGM